MMWRNRVGSGTLYAIQDGSVDRDPLQYLIGSTTHALSTYGEFLNADGTMPNSFSCYLFDTGSSLVMIDTGYGYNAPADRAAGGAPAALDTLRISPGDIGHVVFTHLHPDHVLGSLDQSESPLYANAAHWTLQREVDHWRRGADERSRGIAAVANSLDAAGVLRAVAEPGEVAAGVTTVAAYGHSPGHTAVRVHSGDESVLIVGDLTFSPIQLDHTEWNVPFDGDKEQAASTRAHAFEQLAATGEPFAAGHYEWPGFGRVVVTRDGRRFEALEVDESFRPPPPDRLP